MRDGTASAAFEHGALSHGPPGWTVEPNDGVETHWILPEELLHTLDELAGPGSSRPFLLLDLFSSELALDGGRGGHEVRSGAVVYVLLRPAPFALLRLKVPLEGEAPVLPSASGVFANVVAHERAITARAGARFLSPSSARVAGEPGLGRVNGANGEGAGDGEGEGGGDLEVELALPRALALEALLHVHPPPRASAIRVLRSELLRVASHLSWYAGFVNAVGASAPASFVAYDVRSAMEMVYAFGGSDPDGVVVGGVRDDLPAGWRAALEGFLEEMTPRVSGYAELVAASPRFLDASKAVSPLDARTAASWAITGPILRAAGVPLDLRKARPYCGYEHHEFQVPAGVHGDLYDRARVRLDELRQSLRIIAQCADAMPEGPFRVEVASVLLPGEALAAVEGSQGVCACSVESDGEVLLVHERAPGLVHRRAFGSLLLGPDEHALGAATNGIERAAPGP